jgi:hypothetical protein
MLTPAMYSLLAHSAFKNPISQSPTPAAPELFKYEVWQPALLSPVLLAHATAWIWCV